MVWDARSTGKKPGLYEKLDAGRWRVAAGLSLALECEDHLVDGKGGETAKKRCILAGGGGC